jgi:hypothetical protein
MQFWTWGEIQYKPTTLAGYGITDSLATGAQGALAATALQPVVTGAGIHAGGFNKHALIAGGAAGDHTLSAAKSGDELDAVIYFPCATSIVSGVVDLTSEFTLSAGKVNNTGHTDTTGGFLLVFYTKLTTV